jgi:hypothetical protein
MKRRKVVKIKCRFCRQLVEASASAAANPKASVVCAACLSSLAGRPVPNQHQEAGDE